MTSMAVFKQKLKESKKKKTLMETTTKLKKMRGKGRICIGASFISPRGTSQLITIRSRRKRRKNKESNVNDEGAPADFEKYIYKRLLFSAVGIDSQQLVADVCWTGNYYISALSVDLGSVYVYLLCMCSTC